VPELDLEALLKPIRDDAPCGDDLSYDADFLRVRREAESTPDETNEAGEVVRAGKTPNWRELRDESVALLARGRHLQLTVFLALSMTKLEGYAGLASGLRYLRGCLEQYWEPLFPRLDPDLQNDPGERVALLTPLVTPRGTFGDPYRFIERVFESPLTDSAQFGKLSLKDVAVAAGTEKYAEAGRPALAPSLIEAAFDETSTESLETTGRAIEAALADVVAIGKLLDEKAGSDSLNIDPLKRLLSDAQSHVRRSLARRGVGSAAEAGGADTQNGAGGGGGEGAGGRGGEAARLSGEIVDAEGVRLALQKILKYYAKSEVSSPVPYVVRAAEQLVGKKFREIYQILSPEAVALLERIAPETDAGQGSS
jgi:type VI secretion system protein ImpA